MPAEDVGFVPGTVLHDKYRVICDLGSGGMSLVVCAEHVLLGRKVAMKFLLPGFATLPDAPRRFIREAKAAWRVKSEHVAEVIDADQLPDGMPYMVMEYLEGKDLGRYIREGTRFPVVEAIDLTIQAADALSRAHAAGVIHRDVKPSNLFLTRRPDGSPLLKVLDFGISKVLEDAAEESLDLTKTTAVMGSALYMSLEQMRSTKTVDRRTDIYALGVSLYEMLTGTHPFTAASFSELCVKVSLDPPEPLRKLRPDVPEALAEAIAVAYARDKGERYQTAGALAAALKPFAAPETVRCIEVIEQFEKERYPDGKIPERLMTPLSLRAAGAPRPPRIRWERYAAMVVVCVILAGVLFFWRTPPEGPAGVDAGSSVVIPSGGGTGGDTASAGAGVRPATVPTAYDGGDTHPLGPAGTATATMTVGGDAGVVDAGATLGRKRFPAHPCPRDAEVRRDPTSHRRYYYDPKRSMLQECD